MTNIEPYKTMPFSCGGVWPHGIPISQSWASIGAIFSLIHTYKIKTFVEIGTDQGGLGYLLSTVESSIDGFRYHGIEKYPDKIHETMNKSEFRKKIFDGDFFAEDGQTWLEEILINSTKPIMVLCDNGNKPEEVRIVSEKMKLGYILSHDYPTEFKETDQPENTKRIENAWLPGTNLYLMKKGK